jgi:hypothetical protein
LRIPLDVLTRREKVPIILDGKTLEATLKDVPLARPVVRGLSSHRLSGRDPPQKPAHLAIAVLTQHQVPVTGHQPKAIQWHRVTLKPCGEHSLERFVVGLFAENPGTRTPSIQGMLQPACFIGSRWSSHPRRLPSAKTQTNKSWPF